MSIKKVVILRGCPGSGKTTLRKEIYPTAFVCSVVDYHTDHEGKYKFFRKGIPEAHTYSQNTFMAALKNQLPLIAVDNTNTKLWEFEWYIEMAVKYGYEVEVIRMQVFDVNIAASRNIHGVPLPVVLRMHENMEDYIGEFFS